MLADRLILRHLRISVPTSHMRHDLQRGRKSEPLLEQQIRCIAVVGAGASVPLLQRGDELATQLEEGHKDDKGRRAELFRLQRVYGLDPQDFETRLAALSRTPESAQGVREEISEQYAYRHPTILGYELLAHLLKHRFLDAVISFNFDELLDQSLDDELGADSYRRLVSDRDCVDVEHNADSHDYLPLYIKLHGTATEPDSIRLTRDAYYKLPQKLMEEVEGLFESRMMVVINLGSAMTGFDLHRLLRIPQELEIYDLSLKALEPHVCEEIESERLEPKADSIHSGERRKKPKIHLLPDELPRRNRRRSCDDWLKGLTVELEERSGTNADQKTLSSLVRFRSIDRHDAIAAILGPRQTLSRWTKEPEKYRADYVQYLRQRTVIELSFSGAKARGLAQLSWLAVDRSGAYYDLYRRAGRSEGVEPWSSLRAAAGLNENEWLPDVVEAQPELCGTKAGTVRAPVGRWALRQFAPKSLAKHVAMRIGKSERREERILARTLEKLQEGSEVEIQTADDQVCAKAFDHALPLPTVTALRVFTMSLFRDLKPSDEVYISCETGEWLLGDSEMQELVAGQQHVVVVTAFDFKRDELGALYGDRLTVQPINPWRHNRHMTIVCSGDVPTRAVYFARRLRTPMITPVYLDTPKDAARVKHAFDLMRDEELPIRPSVDEQLTDDRHDAMELTSG